MQDKLKQMLEDVKQAIHSMNTKETLQEQRVKYLGKKGELTQLMKQMGQLPQEERPRFGQMVNAARTEIERLLEEKRDELAREEKERKLREETIDVTQPTTDTLGGAHPKLRRTNMTSRC